MFGRSRRVPAYEGGAPVSEDEAVPASTVTRRSTPMAAPAVVNPGAGLGLGSIGFLTLVLGAWAGIVPFVGPLFGFSATGRQAWVWNLPNALLWLVPGAVAVFFGLVMLARAPFARTGIGRGGHLGGGFIVACCGAWLAIGPFCWRVLEGGMPIRGASPLRELWYWIGYSIGPGVLLALLGGAAMGVAVLTRRNEAVAARPASVREEPLAA